ncbi:MAG TPA: hypothetical protein VMS11_04760 [Solirubrobacterales bacterium]|nr:hypothetical protein [Solirubrobacterales bacterium]
MRFPKKTVAAIHDAAPGTITVRWPGGAEPQKGRVYWLQSAEDAKAAERKAKNRREYSPETHHEVLAHMYKRRYGKFPAGYKPKRRKAVRRKPPTVIHVVAVEILDRGWEATVALFDDPDPVRHLPIKTRVPAGQDPLDGFYVAVELEPEQIIVGLTRPEREDSEDTFKLEHQASVDSAEIRKWEKRIEEARRKRKPTHFAEAGLERARRRVALDAAAQAA